MCAVVQALVALGLLGADIRAEPLRDGVSAADLAGELHRVFEALKDPVIRCGPQVPAAPVLRGPGACLKHRARSGPGPPGAAEQDAAG